MELAIIEAVEVAEAADKQKVTCYVCDKQFFDAGTQWLLEGDHMVRIMTSSSPGISVIGMGG